MIINRKYFAVGVLFACLMAAGPAAAFTFDGTWDVSSGSMYAVQTSLLQHDSSLYLYNLGNTAERLLVLNDSFLSHASIYFTNVNNIWYAGRSVGAQDLTLGTTPNFGFLFMDGDGIHTSYDLTPIVSGNSYELRTSDMDVIFADAKPVPEPSTLLLLGVGLIGVAVIGLRKRPSRF